MYDWACWCLDGGEEWSGVEWRSGVLCAFAFALPGFRDRLTTIVLEWSIWVRALVGKCLFTLLFGGLSHYIQKGYYV